MANDYLRLSYTYVMVITERQWDWAGPGM